MSQMTWGSLRHDALNSRRSTRVSKSTTSVRQSTADTQRFHAGMNKIVTCSTNDVLDAMACIHNNRLPTLVEESTNGSTAVPAASVPKLPKADTSSTIDEFEHASELPTVESKPHLSVPNGSHRPHTRPRCASFAHTTLDGSGELEIHHSHEHHNGDHTGESDDDEIVLPDREELRDMLEWDLGVAETLFRFKQWQIREQIEIDSRSKRSRTKHLVSKKRTAPRGKLAAFFDRLRGSRVCKNAHVPATQRRASFDGKPCTGGGERRRSCADNMRASQACGFAFNGSLPSYAPNNTDANVQKRKSSMPKFLSVEFKLAEEMRSKSQRALFEGLANTADMSRDRWFVLRPGGTARHVWANVVALATGVTAIIVPLVACKVFDGDTAFTKALGVLVDIIFAVDLGMQFVTAYQDEVRDIIVTSPSHIRNRYLRTWFGFDVVSALPIDWIHRSLGGSDATVAYWRLLKLTRAYHLFSENDVHINLGDTAFNPSMVSLVKLTGALSLFWHMTACLYTFMSIATIVATNYNVAPDQLQLSIFSTSVFNKISSMQMRTPGEHIDNGTKYELYETYHNDSFSLSARIVEDSAVWHMPLDVWRHGPGSRYLYAISWAIAVTCQTNRPTPNTFMQMVMSDAVSVSGLFLMTGIIGAATAAIAEIQAQRSEMTRLLQRIAQYMRNKRLPRDLRRRVLSFYRFHQSSMNILENEEVLVGLPRAMRMQINLLMHKPVFVKLPLFWLCSEEEMLLIVQRLRPCLMMPGEMMLKEGTIGVGLFLLMKGAVETTSKGELLVVLLAVAAFGEAALQSKEPSDITIRALRFCETSLLLREDWLVIEKLNPRIRVWLEIYIAERDRKIRDPNVKNQSQQTKKATIRCGTGGYREWSDVTAAGTESVSGQTFKDRAKAVLNMHCATSMFSTKATVARRCSADVLGAINTWSTFHLPHKGKPKPTVPHLAHQDHMNANGVQEVSDNSRSEGMNVCFNSKRPSPPDNNRFGSMHTVGNEQKLSDDLTGQMSSRNTLRNSAYVDSNHRPKHSIFPGINARRDDAPTAQV